MKLIALGFFMPLLLTLWAYAESPDQKTYELSPAKDIIINAFGRVEVQQGNRNQLTLFANGNLRRHVQLTVEHERLVITDNRVDSFWYQTKAIWLRFFDEEKGDETITYRLILTEPVSISLNGHLNASINHISNTKLLIAFNGLGQLLLENLHQQDLAIEANGKIDTQIKQVISSTLNLTLNGAGSIKANNLLTDKLHATLNGSIDGQLSGKTGELRLTMLGNASCQGHGFSADRAYIAMSGDSELTLKVNNKLRSELEDNSRLFYYGNPATKVKGNAINQLSSGYQAKIYY